MKKFSAFAPLLLLLVSILGISQLRAESTVAGLDRAGLDSLVQEQRGKISLVNFWATWCSPCLKEIPELVKLQAAYSDELVVLGVALDEPGMGADNVAQFHERYFPEFRTYRSLEPYMNTMVSVIDPAWNEIMPTSYVLDREGNVVETLFGGQSYEVFEQAVIEALGSTE